MNCDKVFVGATVRRPRQQQRTTWVLGYCSMPKVPTDRSERTDATYFAVFGMIRFLTSTHTSTFFQVALFWGMGFESI